MRLNPDVEDLGQRADHQRLGQAGDAFEQAMAPREDGRKQLLDDLVLPDDDFLQLLLHHDAVLAELLQNLTEISLFRGHDDPSSLHGFLYMDSRHRTQERESCCGIRSR